MRHLDLSNSEYVLHVDRWTWDDQKNDSETKLKKNIPGEIRDIRFTHTQTEPCISREECTSLLRDMLANDIKLGLNDIRYNFLVSSTGAIYEGRGWSYIPSAYPQIKPVRINTIHVAYIGNYENEQLPLNMIIAGLNLMKYGIKMNFVEPSCNIGYYKPPRKFEEINNRGLESMKRSRLDRSIDSYEHNEDYI